MELKKMMDYLNEDVKKIIWDISTIYSIFNNKDDVVMNDEKYSGFFVSIYYVLIENVLIVLRRILDRNIEKEKSVISLYKIKKEIEIIKENQPINEGYYSNAVKEFDKIEKKYVNIRKLTNKRIAHLDLKEINNETSIYEIADLAKMIKSCSLAFARSINHSFPNVFMSSTSCFIEIMEKLGVKTKKIVD